MGNRSLVGMLVAFIVMWGIAAAYVWPFRLVTNYGDTGPPSFCVNALGQGWHPIREGPDIYHTWCEIDHP